MSATWKYLLARLGICAVLFVVFLPTGLHPLVIGMIALLGGFLLSHFLLRRWRDDMLANVDKTVRRRRERKAELRRQLAGDDDD